jgi:hypothetical protein
MEHYIGPDVHAEGSMPAVISGAGERLMGFPVETHCGLLEAPPNELDD